MSARVTASVYTSHVPAIGVAMARFGEFQALREEARNLRQALEDRKIIERAKVGGGEIVKLMGTSAWYAPGAAAAEMAEAIVKDSGRVMPCAARLEGQYGLNDIFLGVPVKLGAGGIKEIIQVDLSASELDLLKDSAEHVKTNLEALARLDAAG